MSTVFCIASSSASRSLRSWISSSSSIGLAVEQLGLDGFEALAHRLGGSLASTLGLRRPQTFEVFADDPAFGPAFCEGGLVVI